MRAQAGFTYVIAMFLVAASTVVALRAVENSRTREQRSREAELLFAGNAYYQAIKRYYDYSPGTSKAYPPSLEALLADDRTSTLRRHLRKLYRDPMANSAKWGLVKAEDGGIMGVYSLDAGRPHKKGGFRPEFEGFAAAEAYQDWKFVYGAVPPPKPIGETQ